ncbi:MAG: hypothetical protein HOF19_08890 [Gammaproteobacteria bacterium]|jgi:hypothetical protein|nr:hypothetical protein [Gammaproteobacteria bacterium]MBT7724317.1 hypothetical protein [Gammaproteobacteria bacterium]
MKNIDWLRPNNIVLTFDRKQMLGRDRKIPRGEGFKPYVNKRGLRKFGFFD